MNKKVSILATGMILVCCFGTALAQYKVLYSFDGPPDGSQPVGTIVADKVGNLYGTTLFGGNAPNCPLSIGCGTVFELSPNGSGGWTETVIYSFCSNYVPGDCVDGFKPEAGLLLDQFGNLYGTSAGGGNSLNCGTGLYGCGTIFQLSPAQGGSWSETVLYNFCANYVNRQCLDGFSPVSQPVHGNSSGTIYGTTSGGGSGHGSGGTVFKLSRANGSWQQTTLYNFCSLGQGLHCPDGAVPLAGVLVDRLGNLYGTTEAGGESGYGTVYKLSPNGNSWTETVLRNGGPINGEAPLGTVSGDSLGNLYSTASIGGQSSGGTIFRLTAKGGGTVLPFGSSNGGGTPTSGVLLDTKRNTLYGTTKQGGTGSGNVYQIVPPAQVTSLYNFCSQQNCADGMWPVAGLAEDSNGNLYGTTEFGGTSTTCQSGCGVVFEVVIIRGQTDELRP